MTGPGGAGPRRQGLLLDIGGVVLVGGPILAGRLAARHPAQRAVVDRVGGLGSATDTLWQQMLAGTVSERSYWATRAAELGAAVGQDWQARDLMTRMFDLPRSEWLVTAMVDLMADTRQSGMPLVALTNDLTDFHGRDWIAAQEFFGLFDTIVDAAATGVLKPHPDAFAAGIAAVGLPAADILYLDDMPWNVDAAVAAGLVAHQVLHDDPGAAVTWARERLGLPASSRPAAAPDPAPPARPAP